MKPLPFQIPKTEQTSFRVQVDEGAYFYDRLHYHPEWQITMVSQGRGTLFVGNGIHRFREGDVFAIGSSVPHLLKSDPIYYEDESPQVRAISIFFGEFSFGKGFFAIPELKDIRLLLQKTARGIRLLGPAKKQVTTIIEQVDQQVGTHRFQSLLHILTLFAEAKKTAFLSNARFTEAQEEKDGKRLNAVLQFSLNNYTRPIALKEAAAAAHLSVSAFCHYFKLHTRKPYIQFLNELRINAACKLLSESDRNIAQISYEVGFINLSNFNRQFKKVMGYSPSVYRKQFL